MAKRVFQTIRGMKDVIPSEQKYWDHIKEVFVKEVSNAGFERIITPVVEDAELFQRSVGEETDIVSKEMYTFKDKGGDLISLRPEGTAPVVRAYIEHGMNILPQPVKLFYIEPMFRYERPQAGRLRQHFQAGCEVLGEMDPIVDAELIVLAYRIFERINLSGLVVQINNIGCRDCRPKYIEEFLKFFKSNKSKFCKECNKRIKKNPLRILDCKEESCQKTLEGAPQILDFLCPGCHNHFKSVLELLDSLEIPYDLNPHLVRGLDYYTKTVFEIWTAKNGAQSSVCGGGRYDNLIELLGGKPTPAAGFAFGIERMIDVLEEQDIKFANYPKIQVFVAHLGDEAKIEALKLIDECRKADIPVVGALTKDTLKSQMRLADKMKTLITVIIGEQEVTEGTVILKQMDGGVQETLPRKDAIEELKKRLPK